MNSECFIMFLYGFSPPLGIETLQEGLWFVLRKGHQEIAAVDANG